MVMDGITCAIVLITAILYARKGFAMTIISILEWFVCIAAGLIFCGNVKSFIMDNTSIDEGLTNLFANKLTDSISDTAAVKAMPRIFTSWMQDASQYIATTTATGLTSIVLSIASFIIIVLVIKLVCWLIVRLVSRKHNHGVVGFVDGCFGFIAGIGLGVLYVLIAFAILVPIMGLLPDSISGFITSSFDASYFSGKMYDHNPLLELIKNLF